MQAYAEGFELMHESQYRLDVAAIASLWMHGSVVRSWLLELTARALADNHDLAKGYEGSVEDSGEGRWTLHEGTDRAVHMPVLTAASSPVALAREQSVFRADARRAAQSVRRPRREET